MATISKTPSNTWKALIRKRGWPTTIKTFRTKRDAIGANLTIAIPRGLMLKVAGWTTVKDFDAPEPWYIGSIFFLFLLGAATTKDFADMKGDRKNMIQVSAVMARRMA